MSSGATHRTRRPSRRRSSGGGGAHVNVTPLIDVVMVLIIFYLMVGSLISSEYAEVPLPLAVHPTPATSADVYTINIVAGPAQADARRPSIVVRGAEMDPAALARDLRAQLARDPATIVQLRAARDLPYRAIEPAVRAAARAGATTIRLVTERAA